MERDLQARLSRDHEIIKESGKFIFYHTCGHVLDLYPEFIELGIDAINSQLHCMGLDNVAENIRGQDHLLGGDGPAKPAAPRNPRGDMPGGGGMKQKLSSTGEG